MNYRGADSRDIPVLLDIFSPYVEKRVVLYRSGEQILKEAEDTYLSTDPTDGKEKIQGSVTIKSFGDGLFEVRGLVISPLHQGKNIGRGLVEYALQKTLEKNSQWKDRGIRFFALTLVPVFFEKMGFLRVEKEKYPAKIFFDCNQCAKKDHCDEIAVEKIMRLP